MIKPMSKEIKEILEAVLHLQNKLERIKEEQLMIPEIEASISGYMDVISYELDKLNKE